MALEQSQGLLRALPVPPPDRGQTPPGAHSQAPREAEAGATLQLAGIAPWEPALLSLVGFLVAAHQPPPRLVLPSAAPGPVPSRFGPAPGGAAGTA